MNDIAGIKLSDPTSSLVSWRNAVLDQVAYTLASPFQNEVQKLTDMWDRAQDFGYPSRSDMHILPNGCLVFDVDVAGHVVHFVIWMTFGEIRIGAKVPVALIPNAEVGQRISCCFDGNPCSREATTGNSIVYDWTFREDFASYEHMMKSLRDPLAASIISWRAGEILTHLYISILSFIVEGNGYEVTMRKIELPVTKIKKRVTISGELDAFYEFISARGVDRLHQVHAMADGTCEVLVAMSEDASPLPIGECGDQDGGYFNIIEVVLAA